MTYRAALDARQAQADLDRWTVAAADRRTRRASTIARLAGEGLLALPAAAFPAQLEVSTAPPDLRQSDRYAANG